MRWLCCRAMEGGSAIILTPTVLGPHPGLSILRIWQGIVEIALRIIIILCSILTVAVSVTVMIDVASASPPAGRLDTQSNAGGVFVSVVAGAGTAVEALILVVRFLNIGVINLKMKKFFIVDIIISVVLVVVFVVAGLVQTVFAARWQAAPDSCSLSGTLCRDKNWWKVTTCAAVGCFVSAVLCGMLGIWSLLFILKRWYYKLLQYTSLP